MQPGLRAHTLPSLGEPPGDQPQPQKLQGGPKGLAGLSGERICFCVCLGWLCQVALICVRDRRCFETDT